MVNEIDELKRLAGIVESGEERLDEDAFDFLMTINPKFARALVSNFKRRHFAVALKEVARLAKEGVANPIKRVSQEFGLDARVLQDYAKRAGVEV